MIRGESAVHCDLAWWVVQVIESTASPGIAVGEWARGAADLREQDDSTDKEQKEINEQVLDLAALEWARHWKAFRVPDAGGLVVALSPGVVVVLDRLNDFQSD